MPASTITEKAKYNNIYIYTVQSRAPPTPPLHRRRRTLTWLTVPLPGNTAGSAKANSLVKLPSRTGTLRTTLRSTSPSPVSFLRLEPAGQDRGKVLVDKEH
jgi:hypothetical protein